MIPFYRQELYRLVDALPDEMLQEQIKNLKLALELHKVKTTYKSFGFDTIHKNFPTDWNFTNSYTGNHYHYCVITSGICESPLINYGY